MGGLITAAASVSQATLQPIPRMAAINLQNVGLHE